MTKSIILSYILTIVIDGNWSCAMQKWNFYIKWSRAVQWPISSVTIDRKYDKMINFVMTVFLGVNYKKLKLHQTHQTQGCFCILAIKKKKKKSVQLPELLCTTMDHRCTQLRIYMDGCTREYIHQIKICVKFIVRTIRIYFFFFFGGKWKLLLGFWKPNC